MDATFILRIKEEDRLNYSSPRGFAALTLGYARRICNIPEKSAISTKILYSIWTEMAPVRCCLIIYAHLDYSPAICVIFSYYLYMLNIDFSYAYE